MASGPNLVDHDQTEVHYNMFSDQVGATDRELARAGQRSTTPLAQQAPPQATSTQLRTTTTGATAAAAATSNGSSNPQSSRLPRNLQSIHTNNRLPLDLQKIQARSMQQLIQAQPQHRHRQRSVTPTELATCNPTYQRPKTPGTPTHTARLTNARRPRTPTVLRSSNLDDELRSSPSHRGQADADMQGLGHGHGGMHAGHARPLTPVMCGRSTPPPAHMLPMSDARAQSPVYGFDKSFSDDFSDHSFSSQRAMSPSSLTLGFGGDQQDLDLDLDVNTSHCSGFYGGGGGRALDTNLSLQSLPDGATPLCQTEGPMDMMALASNHSTANNNPKTPQLLNSVLTRNQHHQHQHPDVSVGSKLDNSFLSGFTAVLDMSLPDGATPLFQTDGPPDMLNGVHVQM